MAQLMPLPLTVSCFRKIHICYILLVPADPGSPGQRAVKRVCVCVCVLRVTRLAAVLAGARGRPAQRVGVGRARAAHPPEVHAHVVSAVSQRHAAISPPAADRRRPDN